MVGSRQGYTVCGLALYGQAVSLKEPRSLQIELGGNRRNTRLAEDDQRHAQQTLDRMFCAECHAPIVAGDGVGSGKITDGLFCTLTCFGKYHRARLAKIARRVAATATAAEV